MNKEKTLTILKMIYFIMIVFSPIIFILTLVLSLPIWTLLIYFILVIILYIIIHIIRSIHYTYTCPNCKNEFKINVFKDISAFNAKAGAKVLVCPKCNTKEVMHSKIK